MELPDHAIREIERGIQKVRNMCKRCKGNLEAACSVCRGITEVIVDLGYAGVPEEYWWYRLSEFPGSEEAKETTQEYIDNIAAMREAGLGLLFVGGYGRGKTALGCSILKSALTTSVIDGVCVPDGKQWTVCYKPLSKVVTELVSLERGTLDGIGMREWRGQMNADFLFIDDVGKEYTTKKAGWKMAIFDQVLRDRKASRLPTIISTNVPLEKKLDAPTLKDFYGNSIMSVLRSMLMPVTVRGIDMRKDDGEKKYRRIIMEAKDKCGE
jgi:DNA replication protein DnaC